MPGIPISKETKKIIRFKKKNPCLSGATIARKFGKSRERIRQILTKARVKVESLKITLGHICPQCKGPKTYQQRVCRQCLEKEREDRRVQVACTNCGKLNTKTIAHLLWYIKRGYQHFFCNRKCLGQWLGLNYGFAKTKGPGTFLILKCYSCGKEFKRNLLHIHTAEHSFCSRKCYNNRNKE